MHTVYSTQYVMTVSQRRKSLIMHCTGKFFWVKALQYLYPLYVGFVTNYDSKLCTLSTPTTLNTDIYSEPLQYLFDLPGLCAAVMAKLFSPYCHRRWLFTPRWIKKTKKQELGQSFPKYPLVNLDWKYHSYRTVALYFYFYVFLCLNTIFNVLWIEL